MRRRHAKSPGLSGDYQDLGILSLKRRDSADCNHMLSADIILGATPGHLPNQEQSDARGPQSCEGPGHCDAGG